MTDKEKIRAQWKWIDPKYEYPLCLTREMDEYGDWHYSLSSGKISDTCQYLSLAELERLPDEPVDADAAMKELDEKIKLTKEHGSWEGVDVDKFMDEVRGRESDDLEEEIQKYMSERWEFGCINPTTPVYLYDFTTDDLKEVARHFAEWQKAQMMKDAVEGQLYGSDGDHWVESEIDERITGKEGDKVKIIIIK